MIAGIIAAISGFILYVIDKLGYPGIFFLMALQSFNIPIPSEITMTFSGFLVSQGRFGYLAVVLAGATGNLAGAYLSYKLAEFFTGKVREKSKILKFLISDINLSLAKKWFEKRGEFSVFLGRMVPIVSTFISLPAGLAKMNLKNFLTSTFLGSVIWSGVLTYLGFSFGENWSLATEYFRKFDYIVLAFLILAFIWWLKRHIKPTKFLQK